MYNPFEDNIPEDPIQRVHALARDLAYGAVHGYWPTVLVITSYRDFVKGWHSGIAGSSADFAELSEKWIGAVPDITLLLSFEYLVREDQQRYALTQKSFVLLEQPVPSSIFISYRRQESSAFGLLILARFKALGLKPFLDMNIEPGEEWHAQLEAEVSNREDFICLVGPTTLESEYVRREISWALAANARIIPIWHNGFDGTKIAELQGNYPKLGPFLAKQAIPVEQENPVAYEGAIIQLLNRFGVTP
jgi:hypothetical protein